MYAAKVCIGILQSILRVGFVSALLFSPLASFADFLGSDSCSTCHQEEYDAWNDSHHQKAMQHANAETVLGNFSGVEFDHNGVKSRFFRKDSRYFVNTDGPDGSMQDFEIKYTFGLTPLQQYLVEFPDGRVQTLGIAWDSRPRNEGGQRWFHLYPDEAIDHEDELHWTAPLQNWNYMCADCHTTNFRKGYQPASDTFESTWSEMDVGCEACHGPGEAHVEWANQDNGNAAGDIKKGLNFLLNEREGVNWPVNPASGTAERSEVNNRRVEIEVCASCHSRRGIIREGAAKHAEFLNHYQPALLTENLYHADGQIQEEVYVWGSFLQSRMFSAGVTCSDCHEPHSLELRAEGDAVCAQCHLREKFATADHHKHTAGSPGADCLNCHMPETTYMVVDPRRDHSIRVPRPDLSLELGTPDACSQCHSEKTQQWAADQFTSWYPQAKPPFQDWGPTFRQARSGDAGAGPELSKLILDAQTPDIARATAAFELRQFLDSQSIEALRAALIDESPLVRMAALHATQAIQPATRLPFAGPLLQDDHLAVRAQAAQVLAGTSSTQMNENGVALLDKSVAEYVRTQQLNADRAEARVNLGILYVQMGDPARAEREYRSAIRLEPGFVPGYVNLSDMYRMQGMNDQALRVLREGLAEQPEDAALHHSLGLALVRQGDTVPALSSLRKAADLAPDSARYAYVYGVALNSTGRAGESITVLENAHQQHPNDRGILFALATINRDQGKMDDAVIWARKLLALNPQDPGVQQLLQSLGQ